METVFERAVKCISNGVITKTQVVVDPKTGKGQINPKTGRVMQKPVDERQATVWQCQFKQRGNLPPNIEAPDNPGADAFFAILEDTQSTVLYQMHHPLLDSDGDFIPLDKDPEQRQRGDYMLALVTPNKRPKDKVNPRDRLLNLISTDIPDLEELQSICTGEAMVEHLQDTVPEDVIEDLFSKLTFPRLTGDRTEADPSQVIFIRSDSGFDGLYVNTQTSNRQRQGNSSSATLPEASEPADVFAQGQTAKPSA